jgi:Uncharacterized conserved protein
MQNLWNSAESKRWKSDELEARVYSARLFDRQPDLGCGVGGAVSVKVTWNNSLVSRRTIRTRQRQSSTRCYTR